MSEERPFPITKLSVGDRKLTELFIQHAKKGDKYICWGCGKEFDSEDDFVKHFQTHIDEFFGGGP